MIAFLNNELYRRPWVAYGFLVVASALLITLPIASRGLNLSSDMPFHLSLAEELAAAVAHGDILPGWTFESNGYGSLDTRLYPPLANYTLAATVSIARDRAYGVVLLYIFWTFVGALGAYLFV